MVDSTDKKKDEADPQDSLVDALESIKSLLEKSDSKLAAARESISIASNQTSLNSITMKNNFEQLEIPVLNDIVVPAEMEPDAEEDFGVSEPTSQEIDETLIDESLGSENLITELHDTDDEDDISSLVEAEQNPQITLDYIDSLQKNLEKTVRDSLMKSVVTIESKLKKSIAKDFDKIRKQIKKDLS